MHLAMDSRLLFIIVLGFMPAVFALSVPDNVKSFYDSVKAQGSCKRILGTGFTLTDSESDTDNSYSYCGDYDGLIILQGVNGKLADMDVDCDGNPVSTGGDTRCDSSQDTIPETAFKSMVQQYGISDLNAYIHAYVVFGNQGTKQGFVNFKPQDYGMEPLSVMAVVCGNQMFYGIWGDVNGDDRPKAAIGEASLSLATLCYGNTVNGNQGHSEPDALYVGFTGKDAVAGSNVAWGAKDTQTFQSSLESIGNSLIQKIPTVSGTK